MILTEREQQTLDFIRDHLTEYGRPPYQSEIASHFGTMSRGFVFRMLASMEQKGAISRIPGVPGSISLPADGVPQESIAVSLDPHVRAALSMIAQSEDTSLATLLAEWVSERVNYELRSRARVA